eukprot:91477_1
MTLLLLNELINTFTTTHIHKHKITSKDIQKYAIAKVFVKSGYALNSYTETELANDTKHYEATPTDEKKSQSTLDEIIGIKSKKGVKKSNGRKSSKQYSFDDKIAWENLLHQLEVLEPLSDFCD